MKKQETQTTTQTGGGDEAGSGDKPYKPPESTEPVNPPSEETLGVSGENLLVLKTDSD